MALGVTIGSGTASGAATKATTTAGLHAHLSGLGASSASPAAVPSTYFGAGYFSYPGEANGAASASTTFKMPTFSCKSAGDQEWLLPGIWVYDGSSNLTQQVDVNFNCNSGAKTQEDVICITGASCDTSLTPAPHDTIRASLAYTSTATIGTIKDVTTGQTAQVIGSPVTSDVTVFIGDEGPSLFLGGAVTKVPTFSTIKFSTNQVNGQDLSDWAPGRWNLKTSTAVQIRAGALATNQSFVTTFAHN